MTLDQLIGRIGRYALTVRRGNRKIYEDLRLIETNMSLSADEQQSRQFTALVNIVNYAFENSDFYKKKYAAIDFKPQDLKSWDDFSKIPFLTKEELLEAEDSFLCLPKESVRESFTGGTTGRSFPIYRDPCCQVYRRAIDIAIARYYGWREGQWHGWLWGASRDVLNASGWRNNMIRNYMERYYFLDMGLLSVETYRKFVKTTKRYKPTFVSAYPSLAYHLAELIEEGSVPPVRVPIISMTAEPIYDFQREKIGKFLADEVYERYGAREFGTSAFECRSHNGMHILTDSTCTESVPVKFDGQNRSALIVTDLLNHAMPLIRYRIGDFGEVDHSPCSCGLSSPRLKHVHGRESDIVWRRDGTGVAGIEVVRLSFLPKIKANLQIIQHSLDHIEIKLEGKPEDHRLELDNLVTLFKKEISPECRYEISGVNKIKLAESGKYRYVISHVQRPKTN